MQYTMLVISSMLLAVDFSLNKIYQKFKGISPSAGFGFNSLLGLFTAIVFFAVNGFKAEFSVYSFICAAIINIFVICYNIIGFKLLKSGTMAIYTLFLMSGGMVVPYVFGLLFLNETFYVLKTVALIIILAGTILSNLSKEKINLRQTFLYIAVFFLNGFVSIISKLHQTDLLINSNPVSATNFVLIGGIFKFVLAGIIYVSLRKKSAKKTETKTKTISLIIIIGSAAVGGISYLMQLWGATSLPATVLYPFITGGSIIFSSLAGVYFFKEKLSKNLIVSIILCFIGTIMFL